MKKKNNDNKWSDDSQEKFFNIENNQKFCCLMTLPYSPVHFSSWRAGHVVDIPIDNGEMIIQFDALLKNSNYTTITKKKTTTLNMIRQKYGWKL